MPKGKPCGRPAPAELQRRVARLIYRVGASEAARQLDVYRASLVAVVSGVAVLPGTVALVRERLSEFEQRPAERRLTLVDSEERKP